MLSDAFPVVGGRSCHENPRRRPVCGRPCGGDPGSDAQCRRFVRGTVDARAAERDDYARARRRGRPVHTTRRRRRRPVTGAAGILPRRRDAHAVARFRHQDRGLDARRELERQAPGGRQRGLQRQHQLPGDDDRPGARLCRDLHRHGAHGRRRSLGGWASGEGDRLRLARGARDDRRIQEDHRELLRRRPEVLGTGTAAPPADGRR